MPVTLAVALGVLTLAVTGCAHDPRPDELVRDASRKSDPANERPNPVGPESTLRQFMIALMKGDRERMLEHMKPNPDADILLRMRQPPMEPHEDIDELFNSLPIARARPGDELGDPFTPGQRVVPEMLDENHVLLMMYTRAMDRSTFFLERESGKWRVNMDALIHHFKHLPADAPGAD